MKILLQGLRGPLPEHPWLDGFGENFAGGGVSLDALDAVDSATPIRIPFAAVGEDVPVPMPEAPAELVTLVLVDLEDGLSNFEKIGLGCVLLDPIDGLYAQLWQVQAGVLDNLPGSFVRRTADRAARRR